MRSLRQIVQVSTRHVAGLRGVQMRSRGTSVQLQTAPVDEYLLSRKMMRMATR
jgi:hypothetical protein